MLSVCGYWLLLWKVQLGNISSIIECSIRQRYCTAAWVQMWHEDQSFMWSQALPWVFIPLSKNKR